MADSQAPHAADHQVLSTNIPQINLFANTVPRSIHCVETCYIYSVCVLLALKNHLLQHAGNCVNTRVFARCCPQNIVKTVETATKVKKPCKYPGVLLLRRQKH